MKRRAVFGIIGLLVWAVLAASCANGSPQASQRTSTTIRPPLTSTTAVVEPTSLPVVSCPTTWGISTPVSVPSPVSMTVDVPDTLEAKLAVYSDTDEIMMLLAPKGWTCTASYGADGSGGVDVSPRGAHVPTRKLGPHSLVQAIGGFETGGSPVQAAFSACPYFPAAAIAARSDLPEQACSTRSNSQIVEQISASVVAFEDPPGVDGAGENPANGVMTYSPVKGPGFFIDTCTRPQDEHDICSALLNYFIVRYGQG